MTTQVNCCCLIIGKIIAINKQDIKFKVGAFNIGSVQEVKKVQIVFEVQNIKVSAIEKNNCCV